METKKMNKGIEIRNKKRAKQKVKRNTVKDKQIGVCRFIVFRNPVYTKPGKHYIFKGLEELHGLQIENKLYYSDELGSVKQVFMNKPNAHVVNVFSLVPDWATPKLVKKYTAYLAKHPAT